MTLQGQSSWIDSNKYWGNGTADFRRDPQTWEKLTIIQHKTVFNDDKFFKQPYRRILPGMYEEVYIKEMLYDGAISEFDNPSSTAVLV
ncbi:hypothetical protein CHS0354_034686 [Potamilus streckersoni]|uniref:Uncharacterized protein n=1 Tax=Potamilus streckersoni TaxID=2493646 RepID=A0AAE0VE08_9BIVA|nr:hypothetical protein CHS0354_034686 [Potamilus streckersoni]